MIEWAKCKTIFVEVNDRSIGRSNNSIDQWANKQARTASRLFSGRPARKRTFSYLSFDDYAHDNNNNILHIILNIYTNIYKIYSGEICIYIWKCVKKKVSIAIHGIYEMQKGKTPRRIRNYTVFKNIFLLPSFELSQHTTVRQSVVFAHTHTHSHLSHIYAYSGAILRKNISILCRLYKQQQQHIIVIIILIINVYMMNTQT